MHDRIPGAVSQGLRFTEAVWHAIDTRGDIDQVLLAAAVSGATGKSYSFDPATASAREARTRSRI
jgi:hypothetical protein